MPVRRRPLGWLSLSVLLTSALVGHVFKSTSQSSDHGRQRSPVQWGKTAAPASASVKKAADEVTQGRVQEAYGQLPLAFEANAGQTDARVDFLARGRGYTLFLTRGGGATLSLLAKESQQAVLRLSMVDAAGRARGEGRSALAGKVNYLHGSTPSQWRRNIDTFGRVHYSEVYAGIDVAYYGNQGQLEYDFILKPGADPEQIRMRFEGADKVEVDESGNLQVGIGGRVVTQRAPVIYQERQGARQTVEGGYVVERDGDVVFQLARFDTQTPLVIDPVLVYSTFIGGSVTDAGDNANAVALGADSVYVAGNTTSVDFPTTAGAARQTNAGGQEGFVIKLRATDGSLVYGTFLGGAGGDGVSAISVDGFGNAFVTGLTQSSTGFPLTGSLDTTLGGTQDAFVVKLDASGGFVYGTLVGGNLTDAGRGIAVDGSGRAYVTGSSSSSGGTFPILNAIDPSQGGSNDAFVVRLNVNGTVSYGTFLGGSGNDVGNGIAVDTAGNAYVTGITSSTTATWGPGMTAGLDTTYNGSGDSFVIKLTSTGTLSYGTFIGASLEDSGASISIDGSGNAYIAGHTTSSSGFPGIASGFDPTHNSPGFRDAFVLKVGPAGAVIFSSYIGGPADDFGTAIAVDGGGSAYVAGYTQSTTGLPVTAPLDTTPNGGIWNAFAVKVGPTGALGYGTYLGGSVDDFAFGIAADASGRVYIAGNTTSLDDSTIRTTAARMDISLRSTRPAHRLRGAPSSEAPPRVATRFPGASRSIATATPT
jgi:hypothetical protein